MNPKETQSQAKLRQYVEDLRRNEHFMKKIKRLKVLVQTEGHEKTANKEEVGMDKIYEKYIEYENKVREQSKKLTHEYNRIIEHLSEEYGIDYETISTIFIYDLTQKEELLKSYVFDLCTITDNYDLDLNEVYQSVPVFMDTGRQSHIRAYPVSIDLHRFASKRDVLDFVNKRWDLIEDSLRQYSEDGKATRFRKRKYDLEIIDYIWQNRLEPHDRLATMVSEKFPDTSHVFSYVEIQKIVTTEKIRRQNKIRK